MLLVIAYSKGLGRIVQNSYLHRIYNFITNFHATNINFTDANKEIKNLVQTNLCQV